MQPLKEWNTARLGYTFGEPTWYSSFHLGVDHIVPVNTPIYAWSDMTVERLVGTQMGVTAHCRDVYGKLVRIGHNNDVYAGKKKKGDLIGLSGNTGQFTTGAHTHTDVSYKSLQLNNLDNFIDPMIYFKNTMKVKVIALNYSEQWITKEILQPVVDYFPIQIDFDIEYGTDNDIQWNETGSNRVTAGSMWLGTWHGKYWDDAYDCVVVTMGQKDWKGNVYGNLLGDAFKYKEEKEFIYGINLLGEKGGKRENWGWNNNDQFTGTLRHELVHTLFYMGRQATKDSTHKHDYESKNISLAFKDIDFTQITFKEPKPEFDTDAYRGKLIKEKSSPRHFFVNTSGTVAHIKNEASFYFGRDTEPPFWGDWDTAIVVDTIIKEDITF
jgi:hypothetical protein